jgi:hypothetical protein
MHDAFPNGLYYKSFTNVIYDRNDSVQLYTTMITEKDDKTIISYAPNWSVIYDHNN